MMYLFGNQMEAISLEQKVNLQTHNFPQLKELQIRRSDINLEPFMNVRSIQRARLMDFSEDKIHSFIRLMIEKQLECEHLYIKTNWKLIQFSMETIEKCLFALSSRTRKCEQMYIELVGNRWKDDLMESINLQTMRLIHCIQMTNIKHFRLSIKINPNRHESKHLNKETGSIKQWMKELETLRGKYLIHFDFLKESFRVIIQQRLQYL